MTISHIHGKLKEVIIIHGDEGAMAALAKLLASGVPCAKVWVP